MGIENSGPNRPWRYALAMFGLSITGYMYQTYGTFFYNDKIGLSMVAIGVGNIFFAIWDAFNDPVAGYLSDRIRTRWGRRRPWLLVGIAVFAIDPLLQSSGGSWRPLIGPESPRLV
jgi:GPH family glycoside/pentoside/hexuronide:cation symporter